MLGLEYLYRVFSQFETPPIKCFSGQCSRVRYKKAKCRLCFDYCPLGLIIFDGGIKVDFSKCNGCGICANVCRNGVFENAGIDDKGLLLNIKRILQDRKEIEFVCPKSVPSDELSPNMVNFMCMGRLSEYILISSILEGADSIWVNDDVCGACNSAKIQRLIHHNVRVAKYFLKVWGIKNKIILTSNFPFSREKKSESNSISRRDFFIKFQGEMLKTTEKLMENNDEKNTDDITKKQLTAKVPQKRELLLDLISKMGTPALDEIYTKGFPFSKIEVIKKNCNFCKVCVFLCPVGALEYFEEDIDVGLKFNLSKCTKCGLCQQVCLNKAILFLPRLNSKEITNLTSSEVTRLSRVKCKKCDKLFLPFGDNFDFCQRCKSEREMEESFFEMIKI